MDAMTRAEAGKWVTAQIDEAATVQEAVRSMAGQLVEIAFAISDRLSAGGQVLFFGNGGSAADAQHWAAELSGGFYRRRPALPAAALTANSSQVTAIANDLGFEEVFARPVHAMGRPGDVAVGISTSGRSPNVIMALEAARSRGMMTVGFTGRDGGAMAPICDLLIRIPSDDVARIQEGHELCAHAVCAVIEHLQFPDAERG